MSENFTHNKNTGESYAQDMPASMPVMSLFSGAGGLDLGFKRAGFQPLLAIDYDPDAVATYKRNHSDADTRQIDLSKVDPREVLALWEQIAGGKKPIGVIGGPPCQGFSSANLHQIEDDPRRKLLQNYLEIVDLFANQYGLDFFMLENVPGLKSKKHIRFFERFIAKAEQSGFAVTAEVLDAGTFGIPQRRKRLVIVGINKSLPAAPEFSIEEGDRQAGTVRDAIKGLPDPVFCGQGIKTEDIPYHDNHITMVPRSAKFSNGILKPGNGGGMSFRVLDWDAPSYTVAYGHNEIHIHPNCRRRLSIYEAMLLQGFPHSYRLKGSFSAQVRQVSDAAPPQLGEGVARQIARALSYNR